MTAEERFNAAASVIRNLPKNGAYQPSDELTLRFYGYYKQATEGPCRAPKPAFWQLVRRAKWEAWAGLADMSRDEAMGRYVDELKAIIETMSYNEDVANFLDSLDLFYESGPPADDPEQVHSQASSSLSEASAETTLCREEDATDKFTSSYETCQESVNGTNVYLPENEAEDEFIDSMEDAFENSFQKEILRNYINESQSKCGYLNRKINYDCRSVNDDDFLRCNDDDNYGKTMPNHDINKNMDFNPANCNLEFMKQVMVTLKDLQNNLDRVQSRIDSLGKKIQYSTKMQLNSKYKRNNSVTS